MIIGLRLVPYEAYFTIHCYPMNLILNLGMCGTHMGIGIWAISPSNSRRVFPITYQLPQPSILNLDDYMFWKPANNGQFNSTSAYWVACELERPKQPTSGWNWIWKINTIPRVVFFIWLSCHGRLPTKSLLFKHNHFG